MLYVDIPTSADILALMSHQGEACVPIYLRTTPVTQETRGDRIELKNLAKQAIHQLQVAGEDKPAVAVVAEQLDDLVDDDEFWRFQANSLAIFYLDREYPDISCSQRTRAYGRCLQSISCEAAVRAVSCSQTCCVLALAQWSMRLLELSPVAIESLPKDAGRALRGVRMIDRWPGGRIHAAEAQKVLLRQFAREVNKALRPLLAGSDIPLILAAEPLTSIYRSVNTHSHLANAMIEGNPELMSDGHLGERARTVLDGIYREEMVAWRSLFEERANQGAGDDRYLPGSSGSHFRRGADVVSGRRRGDSRPARSRRRGDLCRAGRSYDLVNEIAVRVIATDGRIIGLRKTDVPTSEALAAILRYAA